MKTSALKQAVQSLLHPHRAAEQRQAASTARATPDSFVAAPARSSPVVLSPESSPMVQRSTASRATAAVGPAQSPYFNGRIHRDGKVMVGQDGKAFAWRGVSEFLLPRYMNDASRSPAENEAIVGKRMDERVGQGFSVLRMFGTVAWNTAPLKPFENWDAYKANLEKTISMAKDRGLYVELTALTDVGQSIPKERVGEYIDFIAQVAAKYDNTFVELCNESFKNGMSKDELYDLGRRFKRTAPNVMLAGSSPVGDGVDGTPEDGAMFGKEPFDYVTLHSERADGDDGYRWVRHMREGEGVSAATGRPVVQDEPIGSAAVTVPGRRDSDPKHFRDGALVSAITGQGFTFHTDRAVTADPNATVGEPGADKLKASDYIPADSRGTHFVNGHWADSPFDVGNQFDSSVVRVFTRMKDDRSGFWTYPVGVKGDLDMKVKSATHLVVLDVETGKRLEDRDFAAGESLRLPKGSDVVIYGGNAEIPELKAPTGGGVNVPTPRVPGGDQAVQPQQLLQTTRDPRLSQDAANDAIGRLYQAVLGREIEPSHPWSEWFANGQYSMAVNGLMQSGEFMNRLGGMNSGTFADGIYKALLGHPAGDALEGAVARVNQGGAAALVHDLLTSDEFLAPLRAQATKEPLPAQRPAVPGFSPRYSDAQATRITERLYQAILGRPADRAGMVGWKDAVARGGLRGVVTGLMGSDEFKNRLASLDVDGLAKSLYTDLLDRGADEGGLAGTADSIRAGRLADRVVGMLMSAEYTAKN